MKTTNEEFAAELTALESHVTVLETQMRTRGQAVPSRPDVASAKKPSATLDEIFSAMGAMESHAAKLRVTARLSTPLAYAPKAVPLATATAAARYSSASGKKLNLTDAIQSLGGPAAFKAAKLVDEINSLEASLGKYDASTVTHRSIQSRIKSLRAQHAELTSGK